jgi:competence protein ComEC
MDVFRFPLARSLLFLIAGIVSAQWFISPVCWPLCLAVPVIISAGWMFRQRKIAATAFLYVACALTGFTTATIQKWTSQPHHYLHVTGEKAGVFTVVLHERLKPSAARERYIAKVERAGKWNTSGKLLLRLPRGLILPVGSRLDIAARIARNTPSGNPDQFEYGAYLDDHGIPAQASVLSFQLAGLNRDFYYFADRLRWRIIRNLSGHFKESAVQLLAALILGARQDISPDVTRNFQAAGAVHILAVSGLHIGFVVLLLQFALRPLPQTGRWRLGKLVFILLVLWLFAGISGFSPSVVRAATMFSIIAMGRHLGRDAGTMHAVFASAFLLLAGRPSLLYDVGFQLSYAAVISILLFEPCIRKWRPRQKLWRYAYDIAGVSLAAQAGTLPLTLFYFHQFPGLFLLTNLLVLPLLGAIMFLGMAAAGLAALGLHIGVISFPLGRLLDLLAWITSEIGSVDVLFVRDIPMDIPLAFLAAVAVLALVPAVRRKNFYHLARLMLAIAMVQSYIVADTWRNAREERLLVFRNTKPTLFAVRKSGELLAFGEKNAQSIAIINSYSISNRLQARWEKPGSLYYVGHKRIMVWAGASIPDNVHADIVVLRESPKLNLERFLETVKPRMVVADGSNYKSFVKRWEMTCRQQKIPFHNVYEKGCFVSDATFRTYSAR